MQLMDDGAIRALLFLLETNSGDMHALPEEIRPIPSQSSRPGIEMRRSIALPVLEVLLEGFMVPLFTLSFPWKIVINQIFL